jgi:malonate transporter and related proteins
VRNPIVGSIALGFLWHGAALPVPGPLHALLALLATAAPGLALFCVGTSLPAVSRGFAREAALAAGLKLAVLPATIGGLALLAGVSGMPLKVVLIAAAMPTGPNAFLVAKRAATAAASATIVVVTLVVSLPLLCGLLAALAR